ncbi:hypothetical protein [Embleya sp. NBC_00896]|uniref:hypothetical protein n=1 Tax=Embleya sp. NBC_00896 TaxID=2975961 RepID=UPI00387054C4|nr:hypothetical protein OG928_07525 [Embleya sp. NBC_00896]
MALLGRKLFDLAAEHRYTLAVSRHGTAFVIGSERTVFDAYVRDLDSRNYGYANQNLRPPAWLDVHEDHATSSVGYAGSSAIPHGLNAATRPAASASAYGTSPVAASSATLRCNSPLPSGPDAFVADPSGP